MGMGIDLVKIDRFKNVEKLKNKILSNNELTILDTRINKEEYLASRFAVKEAFLKANEKGLFDEIFLKEIEVLNDENGKPYIIYKNIRYENVSISHEKEYAIAIVIL